jgi:uncharacterized protein
MSRLIFWIVLIVLVAMAVRSKLRAMSAPPGQPLGPQPGGARADGQGAAQARVRDESERMACCARCGLYFPASETVRVAGRDYCCAAHAHQDGN